MYETSISVNWKFHQLAKKMYLSSPVSFVRGTKHNETAGVCVAAHENTNVGKSIGNNSLGVSFHGDQMVLGRFV
jgi:hypothetical protein